MLFRRAWFLLAILPVHFTSAELSFNRDIRPILSDNCFYCHGPDKNNRKGDLRLDVREELIKLGPQTLIERIKTVDVGRADQEAGEGLSHCLPIQGLMFLWEQQLETSCLIAPRRDRTQCKPVTQRLVSTRCLEQVCVFVAFHTVFDATKKGE